MTKDETLLIDGPFTETRIGAHTFFRVYPEQRYVLFVQWDEKVLVSFDDIDTVRKVIARATSALEPQR